MSHILSQHLSTRENGLLFSLLSQDCCVLACGIVQLVMAAPPQEKEWKSHSFGVVCLVQDNSKHSTFIRVYCLKKAKLLLEQEMYMPFKYSEACSYFHTFPGDECQTGLNFADEHEAKLFYVAVQKQISDNKAAYSVLTYNVCSVSGLKEKLENSLSDLNVFKRQPLSSGSSLHHNDSEATLPKSNSLVSHSMSSHVRGSPQTFSSADEDSMSLAQKKGPLPPLPYAKPDNKKLHLSGSLQHYNSTIHISSWVPPPPMFSAPKPPPSSAALKKSASFAPVKDASSNVVKRFQSFHFNADMKGESSYGGHQ